MNFQEFFNQLHFTQLDTALAAAAGLAAFISWLYYLAIYTKVRPTSPAKPGFQPPVSIIIAARDAKTHLQKNLPLWLEQDYPNFEIIIANDRSSDGTTLFLTEQAMIHPKIKNVTLDIDVVKTGGKKLALTLGIKKAQYPYFLLTDADCTPASKDWLKTMVQYFGEGHTLVLGASPIQTGNGFLGRLIQYENLITALQYLGFAANNKPYMGVGRNLAYSRTCYESVNGFSSHYHIPAGDDDLFVQEAVQKNASICCIEPQAFTYSEGPKTWKNYWRQKLRHLWVGKSYQTGVKFQLFWFPFAQLLFFVTAIMWFFLGSTWFWPVLALLIKWLPEWIVFGIKGKLLKMQKATPYYPFFNLFATMWYLFSGTVAFFKKKIIW